MSRADEIFRPALEGKRIPILTLDNRWHQIFTQTGISPEIRKMEAQVNDLLKRQGKLTTESKDIRKLKKKMRDEIVSLMDVLEDRNDKAAQKKLDNNRRLITECNDKLSEYEEELLDLPVKINEINYQLMLITMDVCYRELQTNTVEIDQIEEWVTNIRKELKKNLVHKQEMEIMNQNLYVYMHDIFGPEVMEIFDMQYNPAERKKTRERTDSKNSLDE